MNRFFQVLLIASFLPFCWLGFMAVHELGHVLMGVATGGTIQKVVIHPFAISRTDISPNPSPSMVTWAGPVLGVLIPLAMWSLFWKLKLPGDFLARFFAGFCLIANGAYIAFGSLGQIGDAGDLLRYGAGKWLLWIFGVVTIPLGLFLWNGLGANFGLGASKGEVNPKAAYTSAVLLVVTFIVTYILGPSS